MGSHFGPTVKFSHSTMVLPGKHGFIRASKLWHGMLSHLGSQLSARLGFHAFEI